MRGDGGSEQTPNGLTECEEQPRHFSFRNPHRKSRMACIPKETSQDLTDDDRFRSGNYVEYSVEDKTLKLGMVSTNNCKRKKEEPTNCNCKELLARVLDLNQNVNKITGRFVASPWIAGCKCYLGTAARAGFTHVKLHSEKKKCQGIREFDTKTYGKVCEKYGKQKCTRSRGEITKSEE